VILKWYFADEEDSDMALSLLDKFVSGELDLLAPSLLEYEVINGLAIAKKRGRIQKKDLLTAVEGFVGLEIEQRNIASLYMKSLLFCENLKISVYDSCYLALADEANIPFVTADRNLFNSAKNELKWVHLLSSLT
jgi:predicted nucleic acid-binding protein